MNRFFIGMILLAVLLAGCAVGSGEGAGLVSILSTPTTHPYFTEKTPTALPSPMATSAGPSDEVRAMANATLTAVAGPAIVTQTPVTTPVSSTSTASPTPLDESDLASPSPIPTIRPEVKPIYKAVYLRSGPGTSYNIMRFLQKGDSVLVVAKDNHGLWYNVELEDGTRGWVAMSVSEPVFGTAVEGLPVAVTVPPLPTATIDPGPALTNTPVPAETN